MVKKITSKSFALISTGLCLLCFSLAYDARAGYITWDPQGTTGGVISTPTSGGFTGSLSQTWENAVWSTLSTETGMATPVHWVEATNAIFACQANGDTPAFTVTMNANHTIAGIFDGPEIPDPCTVTISGTGQMVMPATPLVGFDVTSDTGDAGSLTINTVITGTGAIEGEGNGSIILNGSNNFSGGFEIGGSGGVSFGNNSAFGTGTITWVAFGFIQPATTSAFTITNAMTHKPNGVETMAGNSGGVTFSGPWNLGNSGYVELENIASTITVSGVISGSASLTLTNRLSGLGWTFTGVNQFTGNLTNAGTLTIGGAGQLGAGSYTGSISNLTNITFSTSAAQTLSGTISGSGTFIQQGSGTLTLSGNSIYTGATTIRSNATLSISIINEGNTYSSIGLGSVTLGNGTLLYTGGSDTTSRTFNGTSGDTFNMDVPNGVSLELAGAVTGTAAWTMDTIDTGTLTLSGSTDNSFLGMNVLAGTVVLNKASSSTVHAIGGPLTVANNALVQMSGSGTAEFTNTSTVTVSNGGAFDLNGQSETFSTLNLAGSGNGGTGALINNSGSPSTLTSLVNLGTNGAAIGGNGPIALAGVVSGTVNPLTYVGSSTLSYGGANTLSSGTIVNSGSLDVTTTGYTGSVTLNGTATLELDSPLALSPTATITVPNSPSANIVNLNYSGTQVVSSFVIGSTPQPAGIYDAVTNNLGGVIFGTGLLSVGQTYWDGNGSDAIAGNNTAGGGNGSWDSSAMDWWVSGNADTSWAANNLPIFAGTAGNVTLNASEAVTGLSFTTAGYNLTNTDGISTLTLNGSYPTISIPAGNTAVACSLVGGGTGIGLTVSGPGTVFLSGNNTYAGNTLINGGATVSANAIADSGASAVSTGNVTLTGGTLSYSGAGAATTTRAVAASAATANVIDVPAGSLEIDGAVTGTTLSKTSSGTLILGGAVDNSGLGLAITGGKVIIAKSSASTVHGLGGGTSSVASGAELQLAGTGGFDLYSGCVLNLSSGGMLDVNGQSDSFSTFTLSGTGLSGAGALINSSSSALSSLTNGGSGVVLAGATTIGSSAGSPGSITLASKISGTGPLTYAGSGTLTLAGTGSTYSGGLNITAASPSSVMLTSLTGGGTGTIAIGHNGVLGVNISGNGVSNAITSTDGTAVINVSEPSGNTFLAGSLSGFTGTINCLTASGGTGQLVINNANNAANPINAAATWNVESGATLLLQTPYVTDAASVSVAGTGNSAGLGAFRIDACNQTGNVLLTGNATICNNNASPSTISGAISDGNLGYGITAVGTNNAVTINLAGTNTYSGTTTVTNGTLQISGAGELGSGNYAANVTNNSIFRYASSMPQTLGGVVSGKGLLIQSGAGTLTLTGANTYTNATLITNSGTLAIGGTGSLAGGTYASSISNYGTFNYASSTAQTLSGIVSGTGILSETGPGKLTLSAADTYSGNTQINNGGTLALANTGSINSSTAIIMAPGSIFDVSAYTLSYSLSASSTLKPAGTGTNASTAATIKGASSSETINIGSLVAGFTPTSFSGDTNHPALYISPGSLNLTALSITVSNAAATPLGVGTYTLIQVPSQNITASTTNVTVTGTGLAPNTAASLSVSGSSVNMVVSNSVTPVPVINSVMSVSGNLVFSGTNGPDSGTYYVLTSTNVMLHLTNWTRIATNTFSPTGTFSVTNAENPGDIARFFAIQVQ